MYEVCEEYNNDYRRMQICRLVMIVPFVVGEREVSLKILAHERDVSFITEWMTTSLFYDQ
jgi:hypothetical protein